MKGLCFQWYVVRKATLSLAKMNWNTSDVASAKSLTLAIAHRVGHILVERCEGETPRPEDQYQM